ncbi:hypothetical protein Vafri_1349 [Volvox africanus]|nr:hypothetical protein Vafri_1349 [Volvox africanus]
MGLFSCFLGACKGTLSQKTKAAELPIKSQHVQEPGEPRPKTMPLQNVTAAAPIVASATPAGTTTTTAAAGSEPSSSLSPIQASGAAPVPVCDPNDLLEQQEQQDPSLIFSSRDRDRVPPVEDAAGKDVVAVRAPDQSAGGAEPQATLSPQHFLISVPATTNGSPSSLVSTLLSFTEESSETALQHYLAALGKHTTGLLEAVQENSDAGLVFGAAYRLHKAAVNAVINGENTAMLAALGQDVVRAIDLAGRRGMLRSTLLEGLLKQLREACEVAEVYGKDGWLLHMACNDQIKPDFDHVHNAIVDMLEVAHLEVPGKPFPLGRGVYLDVNRNLRRCLKRMGGGSVAQGLKAAKIKQSMDDALELASHMGLSSEAVTRELAALPDDVPLDVFYTRMVSRQGQAQPLGVEQCKAIFDMYDKEKLGYLDRSGLRKVLTDLGALEGLRPSEVEAAVGRAFSLADRDSDGQITAEEFARYYETLTSTNARKHLRLALGPAVEAELKQFFDDFCTFGTRQVVEEMDNAHFAKFCKDCNLLGKDLTVTDIDLAFARAKPKGSRKLSFEGFVTALAECAERKGVSLEALVRSVLACQGPVARATKAENVRLHDDRSTYTGVYAKGGPKVSDTGHDLASLLDRSDATKKITRGPRLPSIVLDSKTSEKSQSPLQFAGYSLNMTPSSTSTTPMGGGVSSSAVVAKRRSTVGGTGAQVPSGKLQEMWLMWANFGTGNNAAPASQSPASLYHQPPPVPRPEMGVTQFIKLVRETGLLDRTFTAVQAELIFVRVKPKDSAKLSFEAFEKAMRLIAEAKAVTLEDVEQAVCKSRGPMLTARQQ